MSLENLVLFIRDDVVTVKACINGDGAVLDFVALRETVKKYDLKEGSFAVSNTGAHRGSHQLVQIVEVCEAFMGEPESSIKHRWIYQGVDTSIVTAIEDDMTVRVSQLREKKRSSARNQLRAAIEADEVDLSRFENPLQGDARVLGVDFGGKDLTKSLYIHRGPRCLTRQDVPGWATVEGER